MLFFAAGYYLGSGGKLPPRPRVQLTPDGSLLISPPGETNTTTQAFPTPQVQQGGWQLPAGWSVDPQGSVYDAQGRFYATASQAAQW
jgi:hypothetical protein